MPDISSLAASKPSRVFALRLEPSRLAEHPNSRAICLKLCPWSLRLRTPASRAFVGLCLGRDAASVLADHALNRRQPDSDAFKLFRSV